MNHNNNEDQHKCTEDKRKCILYLQEEHDTKRKIFCKDCNRYCYNQDCFDNHQDVCDTAFKCLICNKICLRNVEHRCGIEKCRNCWQEVEIKTHKC